ncbi:unnamed protein product [Didymodactylos carnosus]|uniref:Retrotransposon gag domain-containing protein n=1 Tax=Didymodactylos carnosus TaxID=1234261 RepID=A0A8S2N827_9BILA|nr:unnamed protein product [Didymodactylos carnosus]CAF3985689.1 unnamed protein product [Didymodactylos carnosus]
MSSNNQSESRTLRSGRTIITSEAQTHVFSTEENDQEASSAHHDKLQVLFANHSTTPTVMQQSMAADAGLLPRAADEYHLTTTDHQHPSNLCSFNNHRQFTDEESTTLVSPQNNTVQQPTNIMRSSIEQPDPVAGLSQMADIVQIQRRQEQQYLKHLTNIERLNTSNVDQWQSNMEFVFRLNNIHPRDWVAHSLSRVNDAVAQWYKRIEQPIGNDRDTFIRNVRHAIRPPPSLSQESIPLNALPLLDPLEPWPSIAPKTSTRQWPTDINKNLLGLDHLIAKKSSYSPPDRYMEQLLIKEKVNNMPRFSGNANDDVDEWLKKIHSTFASTKANTHQKFELINKCFLGEAENWYKNRSHRYASWADFESAFRERFTPIMAVTQKFERLTNRIQAIHENVQHYVDDMENLMYEYNPRMAESERLVYLKNGLKQSLKIKVFEGEPITVPDLIRIVKKAEEIQRITDDHPNEDDTATTAGIQKHVSFTPEERRTSRTPSPNWQASPYRHPHHPQRRDKVQTCVHCGGRGHQVDECWSVVGYPASSNGNRAGVGYRRNNTNFQNDYQQQNRSMNSYLREQDWNEDQQLYHSSPQQHATDNHNNSRRRLTTPRHVNRPGSQEQKN